MARVQVEYEDGTMGYEDIPDAPTPVAPSVSTPPQGKSFMDVGRQVVKESAIPTAMGVVGTYLGGLFVPAGAFVGESIGSGAGEAVNQLFGITPPSLTNIGVAAASGPIGRVVGRGLGALVKYRPTREGALNVGRTMRDLAQKRMAQFAPPEPSAPLFAAASQSTVPIPLGHTMEELQRVSDKFAGMPLPPEGAGRFAQMQQALTKSGGQMLPEGLQSQLSALRSMQEGSIAGRPVLGREYGEVGRAMKRDLLRAAEKGDVGAQQLVKARAISKKENVWDKLQTAMKKSERPVKGGLEMESFDPASVIRELETKDIYGAGFKPEEISGITDVLRGVNVIPPVSSISTQSPISPYMGWRLAGAGGGIYTGNPYLAAGGFLIPEAFESARNLSAVGRGLGFQETVQRAFVPKKELGRRIVGTGVPQGFRTIVRPREEEGY